MALDLHPVVPRRVQQQQGRGFMLLEVLIALLIFSLGVLGLVGLQANATKESGQSQYRAQAVMLADELVGMMWAGDHSNGNILATYGPASTDASFAAWKAKVAAQLPGVGAAASAPAVTLTTVAPLAGTTPTPTSSTQVVIQIYWQLPSESINSDYAHNVTVTTQIR